MWASSTMSTIRRPKPIPVMGLTLCRMAFEKGFCCLLHTRHGECLPEQKHLEKMHSFIWCTLQTITKSKESKDCDTGQTMTQK
jgi:hypothetical protein